jgi:GNAT superfamily N-acetyltransferase
MEAIRGILERRRKTQAAFCIREHRVGDMGIITSRHGVLYHSEYGWDERFEALVGRIAADFIDHFDRGKEKCFVAEQNGEVVGSAFVVRQSDEVAKLRLLYVEPKTRGTGLGTRLVRECIAFAKQAGYRTMVLWTNSVLADARRIYQREGFSLIDQEPHHSFGRDLVGETWSLTLCE